MEQTYGQVWDRYVAQSFPKLKSRTGDRDLKHPGDEWGSEESWASIFAKLFESSGVENWDYAIEIGGGGGKYTEMVLRANEKVKLFGFDVSRNFLEATGQRLAEFVDNGRLSLNEIDAVDPGMMTATVERAGALRRVDAMFSIDAMVHVDLQYLTTYWVNAAQVLRPGGRILMTIADPTSASGFQKIRRDIRKFFKFQGRMCPKFEYLSEEIVRAIMDELGFNLVCLEQWHYFERGQPRDLYLIAELNDPAKADRWRSAIQPDDAAREPADIGEGFSEMWDRNFDYIASGGSTGPRAPSADALATLLPAELLTDALTIIELGGGELDLTKALLAAAPRSTVLEFTPSGRAKGAYDGLPVGRVVAHRLDPVEPDGIVRACEARGLVRQVDAFVSLNVLQHIDLQYMFAYLVNASQVLRPGGMLLLNTGDASSPEGVRKLLGDIRRYFPDQGRPCPRFEYQSPAIMRHLLTAMGFEIDRLDHWTPGGDVPARDLYVVATFRHPEMAKEFRGDISIGLLISIDDSEDPRRQAFNTRIDAEMAESTKEDQETARVLGQAYWRQAFIQANPDLSTEEVKTKLNSAWGGARRDYTRLGFQVLRQLQRQGYSVGKPE